jgi:hypothetical protein
LNELARTKDSEKRSIENGQTLSFSEKKLAFIINFSEISLQRYPDNTKLEKTASEKVIQLAKYYERGDEVWGDLELFKRLDA